MKRVLEFLRSSRVFYLATVDGDQPRVRPLGFFMEFEGRLYLGVGTHKNVYRQVRDNPKIEVCATGGMGEWMRITATAVIDQRQEVVCQRHSNNPHSWQLNSPHPEGGRDEGCS